MSRINKMILSLAAFGVLSLTACSKSDQSSERVTQTAQPSQMQQENEILTASASLFEDLTEFAVAANTPEMDRALQAIEERSGITRPILDYARREKFDSLLARIRAGREAGAYTEVALNSVEGYRFLVEGLNDEVLTVPKAVSLLDYAGFRLSVLASSQTPDWAAIRITTDEARAFWTTIAGRVERKGLNDAMNTTITGIESAVEAQDARMTVFAARVDLDLVDLLESYFDEVGHVVKESP